MPLSPATSGTPLQNAATATGNGTALNVAGYAQAIVHVISSPSMSGGTTVNFEVSVDGVTWATALAQQAGTSTYTATTTADGDFRVVVLGFAFLRARISGYSAGTVTATAYATTETAQLPASPAAASTVADGANVVEGATADAAVITDTTGTLSGKLRGLVKWAYERMPAALGQGTMAQSLPVALASNQSAVAVTAAQATAASLNAQTVGNVASAATDSGNPVKVGGVYNSTKPTFTTGQRGDYQVGSRGATVVQIIDSDGTTQAGVVASSTDAVSNANGSLSIRSFGYTHNGAASAAWDRLRGNLDNLSAVASAAYGSTQTQADQTNYNHRGIVVVVDVTAVSGVGTFTFEIDGKDPVSGKYYSLLTSASIATVQTLVLRVYPGLTAAANTVANDVLPRTWRIKANYVSGTSLTFSVGAMLVL